MSVLVWLHTQDVHATFELQGLFDGELRRLGNVSQQAIRSGRIEFLLNNHLYLLCDCLDLSSRRKQILMMRHDVPYDTRQLNCQ